MDNIVTPSPSKTTLGFMAPSPTETSNLDPYAFPAEECDPNSRSRTVGGKPLQLSVHPRTVLPPGNPLPHADGHFQRGAEFFQQQFSAPLLSPVHGSQPSQPEQHFSHPSSRLENDSLCLQMDQVGVKQACYPSPPVVSTVVKSSPNGVFISDVNVIPEKTKKKKKQKKSVIEEKDKTVLQHSEADSASPSVTAMINPKYPASSANHFPGIYKVHTEVNTEARMFHTKSPASMFSSSGDNNSLPSVQGLGSHVSSSFPTTTTATTFTNSLSTVPQNRRLSADSMELPISRPASRTSTVSSSSGTSDGKSKEIAESISMSKILEIIEREKMLGSATPCKRRRTAKPQHIQEAEEEAKRFAAANAQGVPAMADHASRGRNISAGFPPEKMDGSSRTSSQVSSPNIPALAISPHSNSSSNDQSERTQPQFHAPMSDGKDSEHVVSECKRTVAYSASDGSYLDPNKKQGALSLDADNTTNATLSHSTVSTQSVGTGFNPDEGNSSLSGHSYNSLSETADNKLAISSFTEHQSNTLIAQEKISCQNVERHISSDTHSHHIFQESVNSTHLNKEQENIRSDQVQDSDLLNSATEHCSSTVFPAPGHGQHLKIASDILIPHISSNFPYSSSLAAKNRNHDVSLQNSMQTLFHQSSSSSSIQSRTDEKVPSTRPSLSASHKEQGDQDQTSKLSLTSDHIHSGASPQMYRTQSETADTISGNDFLLSKQSQFSSMPASAAKKPKKKPSPSKPNLQVNMDSVVCNHMSLPSSPSLASQKMLKKASSIKSVSSQCASTQSSAFPDSSFSSNVTSAGSLPPFGAFAGMKTDVTHSSLSHISDGSSLQCLNYVNVAGIEPSVHRNAPANQVLSTDKGYVGSNNKSYESVGNGSSMRCANTKLIESSDNGHKIKQEINLNSKCNFPNTDIVGDAISMHGKCTNLNSNDVNTVRLSKEQQFEFQITNSQAIHHSRVTESPIITLQQGSPHSLKYMLPSQDQTKLNLKPVMESSKDCSPTTSVIACNSTPLPETFHGKYLAHEKAAFRSGIVLDKTNGSRTKPLDISGITSSPTLSTIKTSVAVSQGTTSDCGSVPVCVNNCSAMGRSPPLHSRMPGASVPSLETDRGPLRASFDNGKREQQDKPPGGKCMPQDKLPSVVMNGWNGKLSAESQTWKREKIAYRKPHETRDAGVLMSNRFGRINAEDDTKKVKPDIGLVMNGSLPDFKRSIPGKNDPAKPAPSAPEPKLEPSLPPKSPEEELDERLRNNQVETPPLCGCLGPDCKLKLIKEMFSGGR